MNSQSSSRTIHTECSNKISPIVPSPSGTEPKWSFCTHELHNSIKEAKACPFFGIHRSVTHNLGSRGNIECINACSDSEVQLYLFLFCAQLAVQDGKESVRCEVGGCCLQGTNIGSDQERSCNSDNEHIEQEKQSLRIIMNVYSLHTANGRKLDPAKWACCESNCDSCAER